MNLTVRPVTVRADARIAPRRPAGYAYVVAGASRPQQRGGGLPSAGCLALRAAQPADEADFGRQSLRLFRPRGLSAAPLDMLPTWQLLSIVFQGQRNEIRL